MIRKSIPRPGLWRGIRLLLDCSVIKGLEILLATLLCLNGQGILLPLTCVFDLQEDYVEYSRTGSVIKGLEKAKVKSMYEEDVYINNHTVRNKGAYQR